MAQATASTSRDIKSVMFGRMLQLFGVVEWLLCLALPADSCAHHWLSYLLVSQQHRQWMFTLVMPMMMQMLMQMGMVVVDDVA